ncbi:U3 small nucleolar RNA-associated protein 14 homolog A [Parambassis ranga]|uniref:U3 small nucleolar RNA-associated protein 14 homolog A n=1 Tax=Parambassis ranga TaxID=210632 RepID=A0A6P7HKD6_9TELE|nr:U3 small nucleolar RNA-associated protein 14 homolog A-like [Parambassis ranga]
MAKVSKKKVSKKSLKKSSEVTGNNEAVATNMIYDDDEKEDDLDGADVDVSGEEDEDGEDERKRQKLLEAISGLGGKRKKTLGERSEAAVQMCEFTVTSKGDGEKIDLSDLIETIEKTPSVPAKAKKQLKTLQRNTKTVECPLSKQENERIQRDVSFQKAATEVSRWKSIITQNRKAEQLVFPLNQEPSGPKPIDRVVTGWKAQTPLEQEIFALLSANKQPINDPILTPFEEASVRAMSLEEAKIRRAELQKARALQSYYESKARREKKIKSKKYHKVQNKVKRKEFLKEFDEMVKMNPAAALEELNKMELARMQERMSLKHQNSGKWAKSKAIMAKYDLEARTAIQQQLKVNKDLTQNLVSSLKEEEEEEEEEEPGTEVLPDFVNDAKQPLDSSNPWMSGKLSEDPTEKEMSETRGVTVEEPITVAHTAEEEEEEGDTEKTEEEALLREFDSRRKLRWAQEADPAAVMSVDDDNDEDDGVIVADSKPSAEEADASDGEEEGLSEFTSLFRGIVDGCREGKAGSDTSAQLNEGLVRIKGVGDMELLPLTNEKAPVEPQHPPASENLPSATKKAEKNRKRKKGIELKDVLTKCTKVIKVPVTPTVEDSEDAEDKVDQMGLIKEAFAGDDVVSDFLKDKKKQENAGKPKVVDMTLPGWGEWGGIGLNPSRRKRRRFRIKTTPPAPRKDVHLPSVIISEKRNSSISFHQVNSLPFPFDTHAQFESTICSPVGRTWNTEQTVKKITKPKVTTQLGAIIEPMAQEELLKNKKQMTVRNNSTVDSLKRKH